MPHYVFYAAFLFFSARRALANSDKLWERVMEVKPQLHVFGRIHGGYGTVKIGPTTFANVALWSDDANAGRRPFTITLQGR